MNKVYIIQDCLDIQTAYKSAEVFGKLEVLLPGGNKIMAIKPTAAILRNRLKDFDDTDYLLPTGSPINSMLAAMTAARFNRGKVKVLKWDKKEDKYYVIQLEDI